MFFKSNLFIFLSLILLIINIHAQNPQQFKKVTLKKQYKPIHPDQLQNHNYHQEFFIEKSEQNNTKFQNSIHNKIKTHNNHHKTLISDPETKQNNSKITKSKTFLKKQYKEHQNQYQNDNNFLLSHKLQHSSQQNSHQKQLPSEKLYNYYNVQYYGDITFGIEESQKTFTLQFDTGSNNLWICSQNCKQCGKVSKYDCNISPTCEENFQSQYTIQYGQGLAIGFQAKETLWIDDSIKLDQMEFILITYTNEFDMSGLQSDGICGLGQQSTLLEQLKQLNYIQNSSFSLFLTNSLQDEHQSQLVLEYKIKQFQLGTYGSDIGQQQQSFATSIRRDTSKSATEQGDV